MPECHQKGDFTPAGTKVNNSKFPKLLSQRKQWILAIWRDEGKHFTRELKRPRRRRQRERHKTKGLMSENNASARAFYILVHFFAVPCKTTTSNDQIKGSVENVNTRRLIFLSLFEL